MYPSKPESTTVDAEISLCVTQLHFLFPGKFYWRLLSFRSLHFKTLTYAWRLWGFPWSVSCCAETMKAITAGFLVRTSTFMKPCAKICTWQNQNLWLTWKQILYKDIHFTSACWDACYVLYKTVLMYSLLSIICLALSAIIAHELTVSLKPELAFIG